MKRARLKKYLAVELERARAAEARGQPTMAYQVHIDNLREQLRLNAVHRRERRHPRVVNEPLRQAVKEALKP